MRHRIAGLFTISILVLLLGAPANAACYPLTTGDAAPNTAKADLNTLKNRTTTPSHTTDLTVADVLAFDDEDDAQRDQTGVVLTGVMLDSHHEGKESPNCKNPTRRDFHIWIGARGADTVAARRGLRKKSVVVELTPNIQDEHPDWGARLTDLHGKYVCIKGWLMFDPEHPPQLNKTRGTLWEVHPILGIGEVGGDGTCRYWN